MSATRPGSSSRSGVATGPPTPPPTLEEIEGLEGLEGLEGGLDSDGGVDDDEEYGNFDEMFDPVQAFGQLFVTQNEATNTNETIADILAGIRDILDKGVKVLYKINMNLEKKK